MTGMAEYIERESAIESIMSQPPDAHYPHWYADKIKALPAADVAPVRHGLWRKGGYVCGETEWQCSACGETEWRTSIYRLKYCPFCGAKMDGDASQEMNR